MAYGDFEDLPRRTAANYYMIKQLIFLKILNMKDIKEVQLQWFISFLIKRLQMVLLKMKSFKVKAQIKNYAKTIIRKFGKRKLYSSSLDNILSADLAGIQLRRKFSKEIYFLLSVIDIYKKQAWVVNINKVLQLLILFKKYQMSQALNQIMFAQIKAVNFIIDQ